MYRVVGCNECRALWVLSGQPETARCPRCGRRHRVSKLRAFHETGDEDAAREYRAAMLAERQREGEAFADLDDFAALGDRVDDVGVDDEEYLAAWGIDPEAVAAAGERAEGDRGGQSRREVVRAALRELDAPDEAAVVEYAGERGVPAGYVREALRKLRRAGEVAVEDGAYRLL